jgi:putative MATE family efflux protein
MFIMGGSLSNWRACSISGIRREQSGCFVGNERATEAFSARRHLIEHDPTWIRRSSPGRQRSRPVASLLAPAREKISCNVTSHDRRLVLSAATLERDPSMMKPSASLTEGPITKTLVFFSLPILASNVLQSLNGSINSVWVGRYLGGAALTATSNTNTILFFLIGTVFGVGMAATILIGQSLGAKDVDQAKRIVGTSATFFFAVSVAVSVFGYAFSGPMLHAMRTPPDALLFAIAYMRVIFLAVPFIFLNAFVMMSLRGAGDSKTPLVFALVAVGLDIALNPLFIFGLGPMPAFGIAGAAGSTLIANAVSLFAILFHLRRRNHFLWLKRAELSYFRIDRRILRALVTKGIPIGLQMIVLSGSAVVMITLVNGFGSATSSAFGAGLQIWNYVQMPAMAIGMSVSSMAAQNVGAKRWDRVARIAGVGVAYSFLVTVGLALVIFAFDRGALSLFLTDPAAIKIGQHLNPIVIASFTFFGISMVLSGVVRSTGAVVPPLIILFTSLWVVRIPFAWVMLPRWHADAIWWSFPLASVLAALLSTAYYRYGGWKKAHMLR